VAADPGFDRGRALCQRGGGGGGLENVDAGRRVRLPGSASDFGCYQSFCAPVSL